LQQEAHAALGVVAALYGRNWRKPLASFGWPTERWHAGYPNARCFHASISQRDSTDGRHHGSFPRRTAAIKHPARKAREV